MKRICIIILISFAAACSNLQEQNVTEKAKAEILRTEQQFARMAEEEGIPAAFTYFAADSAVLNRGGKIIQGKEAISSFYGNPVFDLATLEWSPDFVDVSESGDLGYTYGSYTFSVPDSTGEMQKSTGVFHSVWKKQPDGSWKYVWD